uniref:Uncharacterized protein n=1 Tax=Aegilops tauschii subsp. strangulata TaxID=200361 RepID=A0A453G037_AEGTS
ACGKRGAIERHARPPAMLSARSLRKASIPPSLLSDPSPGCLQPTRLAVHVNGDGGSCSAYFASGCRVYKLEDIHGRGDAVQRKREPVDSYQCTGHKLVGCGPLPASFGDSECSSG